MATVKRSALVPYSANAMYSLVNDVESYPQFMDGCTSVDIIEHTHQLMRATLCLKKAGMEVSFTTCNQLVADTSIQMTLQDGPLMVYGSSNLCLILPVNLHWNLSLSLKAVHWPE